MSFLEIGLADIPNLNKTEEPIYFGWMSFPEIGPAHSPDIFQ